MIKTSQCIYFLIKKTEAKGVALRTKNWILNPLLCLLSLLNSKYSIPLHRCTNNKHCVGLRTLIASIMFHSRMRWVSWLCEFGQSAVFRYVMNFRWRR